jgi:hypothetical protein
LSLYYFLVASLPALQYDVAPAMTSQRLRALCADALGPADAETFAEARLDVWDGSAGSHPALLRWYRWEIALRNTLARARATARGSDAEGFLRPIPDLPVENSGADTVECEAIARAALSAATPLAGQEILDRARWSLLDSLELAHPFALDVVIAYSLKLQLLERRALAAADRGRDVLERIRGGAVEKIRAGEAFNE